MSSLPTDGTPAPIAECDELRGDAPQSGQGKSTYTQILRSSALIGGSAAVNVVVSIVRAKLMALLLGPAGVGLMGLYSSIADLARSVAGLGITGSGVRQIAEAVGSGAADRIALTVTVLRRASRFLGCFGAMLLVVFSRPVSQWTFGDATHAPAVALLSLAVLFRIVSEGQSALIHGMRRIGDLARLNVIGAVLGTLIAIPLIYCFRQDGVVPALIAMALVSLVISWNFSRRVGVATRVITGEQFRQEVNALVRLGFAFMASGLMTMGAAYAVRLIVLRHAGFEAAGFYQSAWAIGGLYIGIILQAMGADFYPRLTAVAADDAECRRLVNEQAEIGMLVAGPGVVATLTFAPWVIHIFYSSAFEAAVPLLRWLCLGMTVRVIAWPMSFIMLAKGRQRPFFWSEALWTVAHIGLALVLVRRFGIEGAAAAFLGAYLVYALVVHAIVRQLSGFYWSAENRRLGLLLIVQIALVFGGFLLLPFWPAIAIGSVTTLLSAVYSLRSLLQRIPPERLPRAMRSALARLRPDKANPAP